jgi:hypothetical protein
MSKAYLLVICLLAASFTGCLADDTSDSIEQEENNEEETIEPVGTGDNGGNETNNYYYNNDTYYVNGTDYLELISQVENLTVEVEKLRMEIKEMQSSGYDAPDNSTIEIKSVSSITNQSGGNGWETRLTPEMNITKNGNTVTVEFVGTPPTSASLVNGTCRAFSPYFEFQNVEGVTIAGIYGGAHEWLARGFEVKDQCEWNENDNEDRTGYWTTVTFTFSEEPVRFIYNTDQTYTFQ